MQNCNSLTNAIQKCNAHKVKVKRKKKKKKTKKKNNKNNLANRTKDKNRKASPKKSKESTKCVFQHMKRKKKFVKRNAK